MGATPLASYRRGSTLGGMDAPQAESETPRGQEAGAIRKNRYGASLLRACCIIALSLTTAWGVNAFLLQPFIVPSQSMAPTLLPGDRIMVFKPAQIDRGDAIVFGDPGGWLAEPTDLAATDLGWAGRLAQALGLIPADGETFLVKRVIAKGGDTIEGRPDGHILVNGVEVDSVKDQPHTPPGRAGANPTPQVFTVTVPDKCLWVMGDNRTNSTDSRSFVADAHGGCVPEGEVVGAVVMRVWPLNALTTL